MKKKKDPGPTGPGRKALTELALDLRWSWHHGTDELWSQLDPELWALTHNPWVVLQTAAPARIQELLARPASRARIERLHAERRDYLASAAWFQHCHPQAPLTRVAYFSMEFALSEALPIYSGGLGNVAGDQLKAASDLAVPVVGVGLLYQQGYFRQVIAADGSQEELYPYNDPAHLPITPARGPGGEWLRLAVELPGRDIWLRAWHVQVGRVALYLLDSNDPANPPAVRGIVSELYGGGPEQRLRQELLLGIGGWRLLRALRLEPEVCHLNEGHAAFAALERARSFMEDSGQPFDVALQVTRAGNLFTTHTAVPAGFDRFAAPLVERYLGWYARERLGIEAHRLLALGRERPEEPDEPFNMAYLAIRASGAINGVSRLHGAVSRRIFQSLFPRWPEIEVPVGHVTNGVHTPTWDSAEADALWTATCGPERWRGTMATVEADVAGASDGDLWAMRAAGRKALVAYVRERMAVHAASWDAAPEEAAALRASLDPDALTLGFARRFATYKRPNMLLHDPGRLLRLLSNRDRPVQLIMAGKAHPADQAGQDLIQTWIAFARRPEAQGRVIFLPDYDLLAAEHLVQGVDLWINTPRRPWEASGTSGMKVLVNGGLNLSELDGWWAEAYTPEVGWALGDGREHGADPAWDAAEAEALYGLLEREVVPAFYTRDARGMPTGWLAKMRASMAGLTPRFSANRGVREYTETYYLPLASAYRARAAGGGGRGGKLVAWRQAVAAHWPEARFGPVGVQTHGAGQRVTVQVHLGGLAPEAVRVELYANPATGGEPERHAMEPIRTLDGPAGGHEYAATIPSVRPPGDYTPRLLPRHPDASVPLEAHEILWQR
ncbi:MAG TPA: alpha-glucan family phosphorylase [Methylomirabilota bacterium]|jgi:starch phosphorylase|nr:alpha-glucan family phosphorylase [Methylomirabilota bacterium]